MSPQELANVLIKVVGLFMILAGIPAIALTYISLLQNWAYPGHGLGFWLQPIMVVIGPLIGAIAMSKSEQIARRLFREN